MTSKRLLPCAAALAIAVLGSMSAAQQEGPEQPAEPRAHFETPSAVNYDVLALTVRQELQARLADRGFYDGPIDGRIGQTTLEAVSHFQWSQGLEATGYLDAATARALGLEIFIEPPPAQPMRQPAPEPAPRTDPSN